jgi:hypothetical protein
MNYLKMTLKVCEGCGNLWLRSGQVSQVYCARCAEMLKDFPDPKTRRRPGRPPKKRPMSVEQSQGTAVAQAGGVR